MRRIHTDGAYSLVTSSTKATSPAPDFQEYLNGWLAIAVFGRR